MSVPVLRGGGRIKAGPVILDGHQDVIRFPPEADPRGMRPRVFSDVVERLLRDANELHLHLRRKPDLACFLGDLQPHLDARLLAELVEAA